MLGLERAGWDDHYEDCRRSWGLRTAPSLDLAFVLVVLPSAVNARGDDLMIRGGDKWRQ